jgi:hypothetical protein
VEKIESLAMHADSLAWPRAGPSGAINDEACMFGTDLVQIKLDSIWVLQIEGWAEQ